MGCACCKPKEPAPEAASKSLIKPGSQRSDGTTKPAKPSTRMQIEVVLNQAEQSAGFKVRARRAARILRRARVLSRHTHPRALSPHSPACALATQVGCDLNNDNKITKVKPGSAAARAGILVGDTIIELEGAPLGDRRVKDVLVKKPKHSFTLLRPK